MKYKHAPNFDNSPGNFYRKVLAVFETYGLSSLTSYSNYQTNHKQDYTLPTYPVVDHLQASQLRLCGACRKRAERLTFQPRVSGRSFDEGMSLGFVLMVRHEILRVPCTLSSPNLPQQELRPASPPTSVWGTALEPVLRRQILQPW